jgi:GTP-binding protein
MIDITEEDLKKSYSQVRKELKNYSKDLLKKDEIVVLNKTDLLEDKEVKKIKDDFLKKYKVNLITLSTLDKKSISKIKSKIIKYVS